MPCSTCKRDVPVKARSMCAACYQRWSKTGTTEYQRWGRREPCSVGGCASDAITKGLCDKHRKRIERHGHLQETRPDCWGAKAKHPLYYSWSRLRQFAAQHPVVESWVNDFLQFVVDVGDRPSPKHKLFAADDTRPIGPGNFVWKRAVTERVPGEDERTYMNRAQKVYRAVRSEAFQGYELKRRFGMSEADYGRMMADQKGLCSICGKPETAKHKTSGGPRSLAVDHCHSGGHIRALLCSACNTGLGSFNDDPDRLRAAIEYLERHKPSG